MPALARPPGLPAILEGILNLGGVAIPVVKLDRLFGLPERVAGLYTPIIVLRSQNPLALLVDKVSEILTVAGKNMMRAMEAGADDFIGKSSDISVLKARLRALLRHKFLRDQTLKITREFRKREDDLERLVEERTGELKRAETEAREARQVAESANRAKTEFLANMSHELRTPLNAIIGFADMIHSEINGPIGNETYGEYIDDIYESGHHLHEIIHDLLDISSIEVGKISLREEVLNVPKIVKAAWRIVEPTAAEGGLRSVLKFEKGLPRLYADECLLKQAYLNLVSNAIKFTGDGGCITTRAEIDGGGSMAISVTDTGMGIPSEKIEKVLEPFGQIDNSLVRKHSGTGLGLPLAKAFVELHGGTLTIESQMAKGTTVTLRFPPQRTVAG